MSIDLVKPLKKYNKGWVALSSDLKKVVGSGSTPKEALKSPRKKGIKKPVLIKGTKDYGYIAPKLHENNLPSK